MKQADLSFEVVKNNDNDAAQYTGGCSGNRSDCCTRTCTRNDNNGNSSETDEWEKYLEINAGVMQY